MSVIRRIFTFINDFSCTNNETSVAPYDYDQDVFNDRDNSLDKVILDDGANTITDNQNSNSNPTVLNENHSIVSKKLFIKRKSSSIGVVAFENNPHTPSNIGYNQSGVFRLSRIDSSAVHIFNLEQFLNDMQLMKKLCCNTIKYHSGNTSIFNPMYLVHYQWLGVTNDRAYYINVHQTNDIAKKLELLIVSIVLNVNSVKLELSELYKSVSLMTDLLSATNRLIASFPKAKPSTEECIIFMDVLMMIIVHHFSILHQERPKDSDFSKFITRDNEICRLIESMRRIDISDNVNSIASLIWCQMITRICILIIKYCYQLKQYIEQLPTSVARTDEKMIIINKWFLSCMNWTYVASHAVEKSQNLNTDYGHLVVFYYWHTTNVVISLFRIIRNLFGTQEVISMQSSHSEVLEKIDSIILRLSPLPNELTNEFTRWSKGFMSPMRAAEPEIMYSLKSNLFTGIVSSSSDAIHVSWLSSRVRWCLIGLYNLCEAGQMDDCSPQYSYMNCNDWIKAISDTLKGIFSLPYFNMTESLSISIVQQNIDSVQRTLLISNYLVMCLFKLMIGCTDVLICDSIVWIFEERIRCYLNCVKAIRRTRQQSIKMLKQNSGLISRSASIANDFTDTESFYGSPSMESPSKTRVKTIQFDSSTFKKSNRNLSIDPMTNNLKTSSSSTDDDSRSSHNSISPKSLSPLSFSVLHTPSGKFKNFSTITEERSAASSTKTSVMYPETSIEWEQPQYPIPQYNINDSIQCQYIFPNGSKRWIGGRVINSIITTQTILDQCKERNDSFETMVAISNDVIESFVSASIAVMSSKHRNEEISSEHSSALDVLVLYQIQYDDGEIKSYVQQEDLRLSKKKTVRPSPPTHTMPESVQSAIQKVNNLSETLSPQRSIKRGKSSPKQQLSFVLPIPERLSIDDPEPEPFDELHQSTTTTRPLSQPIMSQSVVSQLDPMMSSLTIDYDQGGGGESMLSLDTLASSSISGVIPTIHPFPATEVNNYLPALDMNASMANISIHSIYSPKLPFPQFSMHDKIQVLYEFPSGSKRWLPAKILHSCLTTAELVQRHLSSFEELMDASSNHSNFTYTSTFVLYQVIFDDGEIRSFVTEDAIRLSKRREVLVRQKTLTPHQPRTEESQLSLNDSMLSYTSSMSTISLIRNNSTAEGSVGGESITSTTSGGRKNSRLVCHRKSVSNMLTDKIYQISEMNEAHFPAPEYTRSVSKSFDVASLTSADKSSSNMEFSSFVTIPPSVNSSLLTMSTTVTDRTAAAAAVVVNEESIKSTISKPSVTISLPNLSNCNSFGNSGNTAANNIFNNNINSSSSSFHGTYEEGLDYDDDDMIFNIPSVFDAYDKPAPVKLQFSIVPKVAINEIDLTAAGNIANVGGNSLSANIVAEEEVMDEEDDIETNEMDDEQTIALLCHNQQYHPYPRSRAGTIDTCLSASTSPRLMLTRSNSGNPYADDDYCSSVNSSPKSGSFSVSHSPPGSSITGIAMQSNGVMTASLKLQLPGEDGLPLVRPSPRKKEDSFVMSSRARTISGSSMGRISPTSSPLISRMSNSEAFNVSNLIPLQHQDSWNSFNLYEQQLSPLNHKSYPFIILLLLRRAMTDNLLLDPSIFQHRSGNSNSLSTVNTSRTSMLGSTSSPRRPPGGSSQPLTVNMLATLREYFQKLLLNANAVPTASNPMNGGNGVNQSGINTPVPLSQLPQPQSSSRMSLYPSSLSSPSMNSNPSFTSTASHNSILACIANYTSTLGNTHMRLLKLLLPGLLEVSCLNRHVANSGEHEKIAFGGFGYVYRVICNCSTADKFGGLHHPYAYCMKGLPTTNYCHPTTSSTATANFSSSSNSSSNKSARRVAENFNSLLRSNEQTVFAIKRIRRAVSADDINIFDIFNEITCLEVMSGFIGVCPLFDYGVSTPNSEYWLVMECGGMNILEWRKYLDSKECKQLGNHSSLRQISYPATAVPSPSHASAATAATDSTRLTSVQLTHCLLFFLDILYVVQGIHQKDIVHFDLKANNFVIRPERLDYNHMMDCFHHDHCSGAIFLIDFGEAIPHLSKQYDQVKSSLTNNSSIIASLSSISAIGAAASSSSTATEENNNNSNSTEFPVKLLRSRGTLQIQAPEILEMDSPTNRTRMTFPDQTADIWSIGALLVELLTGKFLFAESDWVELYSRCCDELSKGGQIDLSLLLGYWPTDMGNIQSITTDIEEVIRSMMRYNPKQRIQMSTLITRMKHIISRLVSLHSNILPMASGSNDLSDMGTSSTPIVTARREVSMDPMVTLPKSITLNTHAMTKIYLPTFLDLGNSTYLYMLPNQRQHQSSLAPLASNLDFGNIGSISMSRTSSSDATYRTMRTYPMSDLDDSPRNILRNLTHTSDENDQIGGRSIQDTFRRMILDSKLEEFIGDFDTEMESSSLFSFLQGYYERIFTQLYHLNKKVLCILLTLGGNNGELGTTLDYKAILDKKFKDIEQRFNNFEVVTINIPYESTRSTATATMEVDINFNWTVICGHIQVVLGKVSREKFDHICVVLPPENIPVFSATGSGSINQDMQFANYSVSLLTIAVALTDFLCHVQSCQYIARNQTTSTPTAAASMKSSTAEFDQQKGYSFLRNDKQYRDMYVTVSKLAPNVSLGCNLTLYQCLYHYMIQFYSQFQTFGSPRQSVHKNESGKRKCSITVSN